MAKLRELTEELAARKARAAAMGGPERIAKQHARGKLTARERLALLFDEGRYDELGILGKQPGVDSPADAVVVGFGKIDGRPVGVAAYDFTVLGGSMGPTGEAKVARLRELCLRHRMPIVWLVDSGGARIGAGGVGGGDAAASEEHGPSIFADTGALFREQVVMSGVVPQVAAMVGPGAAGTAYIPGLADFVPMVKGTSSMALGGRHLVKAAVGEDVTEEEMGGSGVHNRISGVADRECADDAECLRLVRDYLSYFPSRYGDPPPIRPTSDPVDRRGERLY
ncbi:MAG TPA: carboxyl transferase domain-containing protein, partial [Myxococcota bacterium]